MASGWTYSPAPGFTLPRVRLTVNFQRKLKLSRVERSGGLAGATGCGVERVTEGVHIRHVEPVVQIESTGDEFQVPLFAALE